MIKKLKIDTIIRVKKNLGLINSDNKYTNLGLLLSDQCPYSIKVARYKDNTKMEFLDSKDFSDQSILSQYENQKMWHIN